MTDQRSVSGVPVPDTLRSVISYIGTAVDLETVSVFVVGGTLRDLLLGLPLKDIDLALEGSVQELIVQLRSYYGKDSIVISDNALLDTAHIESDGISFDIASTRAEGYRPDSSYPESISSVGIHWDVYRRDFTVNALAARAYFTPAGPSLAPVIDEVSGLRDLEAGILRVLHNESFNDDPTRLLRLVRFAYRLGFRVDGGTAELSRMALAEGRLRSINLGQAVREARLLVTEVPRGNLIRLAEEIFEDSGQILLKWLDGLDLE